MKNFKIYLPKWHHVLANIVSSQVVNSIYKGINPIDWNPAEAVMIYKCDVSDEEIEKIRESVTRIGCRFLLEKVA